MSDVSSTNSATSSAAAPLLVNGLISGINTTQVIQALLEAYQAPITNLQNEQTSLGTEAGDYRTLNADMQAVQTAAQALNTTSQWNLMTATSADSSIASAQAASSATPGTLSFTVTGLAQANVLLSSGSVASTAATVTSSSSLLAATGGAALGFSGLSAGSGLALGSHTITVDQSSSAATVAASTPLAASSITSGTNDTLDVSVGGVAYTLTLSPSASALSPSALVAEINTAAGSAGAPITASLTSSGALELQTNEQGSNATLAVTGGDALSTLGLTSGASAVGTDAVVSVDGTQTTLDAITAGAQVTLNAASGSITATVASAPGASGALVAAGSANAALVGTGNESLAAVVASLNSSGLDLSASAVQEASGQYRLQVAAGATGLGGEVSLDQTALGSGALGSLSTITDATNAQVNVGGAAGYTLESSTDTFNNLMAGTAITVAGLGSTSVTVAPDASSEAGAVSSLVTAANQALSDISSLAGYNESTKTAGPLMGSAVVESLQQSILSSVASASGTSGLGAPSAVGITLTSTGTIEFNQSTFESAFEANPDAVAALFTAGGTFSPSAPGYTGQASLIYAGSGTESGTYAVNITQSATTASDTGAAVSGGVLSTGETLEISSGGSSASYTTTAGQSLDEVAAGLNQLFATNDLGLSAFVQGGDQLEIASNAYGSAASFSVTSNATGPGTTGLGGPVAGTPVSFTGTDVAGTINGTAATGVGQELTAPSNDPVLQGLSLLIATPGVSSPTTIGSFTYAPGLAQQLASIATVASNATNGSLTEAIKGLTSQSTGLNSQIANYTQLEQEQQTLLTNQFAQMETTLGQLKNEGSALSSQISDLSGF